jgi:hypothetical protein
LACSAICSAHSAAGSTTLAQIAISLNAQKVSLPGDGLRWHKSSVDRVLRTKYARAIEADLPADD